MCTKLLSRVQLFATLWTVAHQAPLSMGLSRQEYWSGMPFPSPKDLSDPGMEPASPVSPALAGGFFTTITTWDALAPLVVTQRDSLWHGETPGHTELEPIPTS